MQTGANIMRKKTGRPRLFNPRQQKAIARDYVKGRQRVKDIADRLGVSTAVVYSAIVEFRGELGWKPPPRTLSERHLRRFLPRVRKGEPIRSFGLRTGERNRLYVLCHKLHIKLLNGRSPLVFRHNPRYQNVNWALSNKAIAKELGLTLQAIWYTRRKLTRWGILTTGSSRKKKPS